MNGPTNSWLGQFSNINNPCVSNPPIDETETGNGNGSDAITGSCILWLIAGLIIGGLTFSKKKEQRV